MARVGDRRLPRPALNRGSYRLGVSGSKLQGEALYEEVRRATGAGGAFVAETLVPRISAGNPSQKWRAPDAETFWDTPIVGDRRPSS